MAISAACSSCGTKYRVDDKFAGKKAKCKKCPGTIAFPALSAAVDADDVTIRLRDDEPDPVPASQPKLAPPPSKQIPPVPPKPIKVRDDDDDFFANLAQLERNAGDETSDPEPNPVRKQSSIRQATEKAPAAAIAYATPKRVTVLSRSDLADRWVPFLTASFFVMPFVRIVVTAIYISVKKEAPPAWWFGAQFGVSVFIIVISCGVIAPLLLLGIWIAGKMMSFRMSQGSYSAILGILGWPAFLGTAMLLAGIIMLENQAGREFIRVVTIGSMAISIIGMVFLLKEFFGLNLLQTTVSAVSSFISVLAGTVSTLLLLGLIFGGTLLLSNAGNLLTGRSMSSTNSSTASAPSQSSWSQQSQSNSPRSTPRRSTPEEIAAAEVSAVDSRLQSIRTRLKINRDLNKSRESAQADLLSIENELKQLMALYPKHLTQDQIDSVMAEARTEVEQLPSSSIPTDLNTPLQPAEDWTLPPTAVAALGDAVRFRQWAISPGPLGKLDLTTAEEGDAGLSWDYPEGGRLTIRSSKAGNAAQQRPWIITLEDQKAASTNAKVRTIDQTRQNEAADITTGKFTGGTFTRISPRAGQNSVTYLGRYTNDWLEIVIRSNHNPQMLASMEQAARSVRPVKDDELASAFAPERLVPRLADDSRHAVLLLTQAGAAAEPALLTGLGDENAEVRRNCATLLGTLKSEKAVEPLAALARKASDPASDAAKESVRKIAPSAFDDVDEALANLQSSKLRDRGKALKVISAANLDESRQDAVATVLENMLLNEEVGHFEQDDMAAAIKVWHRPATTEALLKMIAVDDAAHSKNRQAQIKAAAATGDKKAVKAIIKWIIKEQWTARDALISMGPTAEDEVLTLLRDRQTRRTAIEILKEVGTKKSIGPLNAVASNKDAWIDQDSAKAAVQSIRSREDAAKVK